MASGLACAALIVSAQSSWSVDKTPIVDVRGVDHNGRVVFGAATFALRLGDGRMIVADGSIPALRFIDAKGRLIKTVGREGRGPGEFQALTWIGACAPDSIFAWDPRLFRVTVFDANGTVGRTFQLQSRALQYELSCNGAGTLAYWGATADRDAASRSPAETRYRLFEYEAELQLADPEGNPRATLGRLPQGEMLGGVLAPRSGSAAGGMQQLFLVPRPLGRATHFAMSATHLFAAGADSGQIGVFTLKGARQPPMTITQRSAPPTQVQYARAVDAMASKLSAGMHDVAKSLALSAPRPGRVPIISDLLTDGTGLVWAVLSAPGDDPTRLRAMRIDGRVVADITVSGAVRVFSIGGDYVLGLREDADGEQHLTSFLLRRR